MEKVEEALERAMEAIQMEFENADLRKEDLNPGNPDGFVPRMVGSLISAYPELAPQGQFLSGYAWATIHAKENKNG